MIRLTFRCDGTHGFDPCPAQETVSISPPAGSEVAVTVPPWLRWVGDRLLCLECARRAEQAQRRKGVGR